MTSSAHRRQILRSLGAGALGVATAAISSPASAFRAFSSDEMKGVLDQGCGATAYHRQIVDEAVRAAGVTLSQGERDALLARLSCPTCRCPLNLLDNPGTGSGF